MRIFRFIDLKGVDNKSTVNSIVKFNSGSREKFEEISTKFNLEYILAILNSKLANYFLNSVRRHRLENYFYPDDFRQLPIADVPKSKQLLFITLVNEMISLNKKLAKQQKYSERWESIKQDLRRCEIVHKIETFSIIYI